MWQHNFFTTKKTFRIVQETAVINFTNERGTSCSTPSGSCSSFSCFCFETLLISAGNKLSCAEDFADFSFAGEIQSDFSCDQESPLWPIPKGLPAPAHLILLPCRAGPVPLSPVLTKERKCPSYALEMPRGQLLSTTFFRGSRMLWANMGSLGKRIWVLGQVQSKLLSSSSVYSVL